MVDKPKPVTSAESAENSTERSVAASAEASSERSAEASSERSAEKMDPHTQAANRARMAAASLASAERPAGSRVSAEAAPGEPWYELHIARGVFVRMGSNFEDHKVSRLIRLARRELSASGEKSVSAERALALSAESPERALALSAESPERAQAPSAESPERALALSAESPERAQAPSAESPERG